MAALCCFSPVPTGIILVFSSRCLIHEAFFGELPGARIGLVDQLKSKFRVAWNDVNNPSLGFKYLYLSQDDYEQLKPGTVNAELVRASSS
jgi:hypothetical protein